MNKPEVITHCENAGVSINWQEPQIHPTYGTDGITRIKLRKGNIKCDLEFGGPVNMDKITQAADRMAAIVA